MSSTLYQVHEEDLAALERELPALLHEAYPACNDPLTRKRWEAVRDIITRIRWSYGPPTDVSTVEDGD